MVLCELQQWQPNKIFQIELHIHSEVITARIRRMTEGNIFSLFTLAAGGGGIPSQVW